MTNEGFSIMKVNKKRRLAAILVGAASVVVPLTAQPASAHNPTPIEVYSGQSMDTGAMQLTLNRCQQLKVLMATEVVVRKPAWYDVVNRTSNWVTRAWSGATAEYERLNCDKLFRGNE